MTDAAHRSGYVGLVGRPNVGKSTLLNQILGQKLSIVSRRPQTTRNRILGIHNQDDAQVLFLDTPGIHPAGGKLLNRRMVDQALGALDDVDLVVLLVDVQREPTPRDDGIVLERILAKGRPVLLVPNKIDLVEKERLLPLMGAWSQAADFEAVIPISAKSGNGVSVLLEQLIKRLPQGPAWFPKDQITNVTERFVVGELIREQAFRSLDREVPYSIAVEVEEFEEEPSRVRVMARIWVERDSQKGIVIGKGGQMLKRIGTGARREIGRLLGARIRLDLTVGVDPQWTHRRQAVERFGMFGKEGEP
jgi:GTPase